MKKNLRWIFMVLYVLPFAVWAQDQAWEKSVGKIPGSVKKQIKRLHQDSEIERAYAAIELGKMGMKAASAIPDLINMFSDERQVNWFSKKYESGAMNISTSTPFSVARACSEAISSINDPASVPLLVKVLDSNQWVYALHALEGMGPTAVAAVPTLVALLNQESFASGFDIRKSDAARVLFKVKKESLYEILQNSQRPAIDYAGLALAEAGEKSALPQLLDTLRNSDLRLHAIHALGRLRDERAVLPLLESLRSSSEGAERLAMIEALGKIGDPRAVPILITCLQDKSSFIRTYAVSALGEIKDPHALEALLSLLSNDDLRYDAVQALAQQKNPKATGPLIALLNQKDVQRLGIIHALEEIRDLRAVEPLIAILRHQNQTEKMMASQALRTITMKDFKEDPQQWQKWWESTGKTGRPSFWENLINTIRIMWSRIGGSVNAILTILFLLGVVIYIVKSIFDRLI